MVLSPVYSQQSHSNHLILCIRLKPKFHIFLKFGVESNASDEGVKQSKRAAANEAMLKHEQTQFAPQESVQTCCLSKRHLAPNTSSLRLGKSRPKLLLPPATKRYKQRSGRSGCVGTWVVCKYAAGLICPVVARLPQAPALERINSSEQQTYIVCSGLTGH